MAVVTVVFNTICIIVFQQPDVTHNHLTHLTVHQIIKAMESLQIILTVPFKPTATN
jgi:hypothetical protein